MRGSIIIIFIMGTELKFLSRVVKLIESIYSNRRSKSTTTERSSMLDLKRSAADRRLPPPLWPPSGSKVTLWSWIADWFIDGRLVMLDWFDGVTILPNGIKPFETISLSIYIYLCTYLSVYLCLRSIDSSSCWTFCFASLVNMQSFPLLSTSPFPKANRWMKRPPSKTLKSRRNFAFHQSNYIVLCWPKMLFRRPWKTTTPRKRPPVVEMPPRKKSATSPDRHPCTRGILLNREIFLVFLAC